MKAQMYEVTYGEKEIRFTIIRKPVKNINLNVRPNSEVYVSANHHVPEDVIIDFVKEKADWILKQQSYFKQAKPDNTHEKEYVSGETFRYLGRQYRLKVIETEKEETVKLINGYFHLYVKDKNNLTHKAKLLDEWYRNKAFETFHSILDKLYPLVQSYGISKPSIQIRLMKARWGSCLYKKNTILLNYELIKAPIYCIEYVILHELIHFIHRHHSKRFYRLLTVLMPDWKERKAILDKGVIRYL